MDNNWIEQQSIALIEQLNNSQSFFGFWAPAAEEKLIQNKVSMRGWVNTKQKYLDLKFGE